MSSLRKIESIANELMNKKFPIQTGYNHTTLISAKDCGYTFKWDNARSRFGCCRTNYNRATQKSIGGHISLSKGLCAANLDKVDTRITNTILHEIAHALSIHLYGRKNGGGHGYNWRQTALAIGCDGERCYEGATVNQVAVKSKYTNTCPSCKNETPSHKKRTNSYACTPCCKKAGGGYRAEFKLIVTQNY